MKKRSEADSKYTWKLEDMVAEDSQWEQMFKEAAGEISEYASYKGRLAGSADTLYACLLFDDKLSQKIERLYAAGVFPASPGRGVAPLADCLSGVGHEF